MTEAPLNHPTDDELRSLSAGQLCDEELSRVSTHLADCPGCSRRIDELGSDDPLLARLQQSASLRPEVMLTKAQRRTAVRALRQGQEPQSADGRRDSDTENVILPAPQRVGDYDILAEVGRGGMGVVYKARHRSLHRLAALKMVLAGEFASFTQQLRFRLEAELAARVQHPNIVHLYEIGAHDGRLFLAMEWVEGGSLADRLDGKPWPVGQAAALVETLARAIHVAHAEGVVHRDLKPANILLQKSEVRSQKSEVRCQKADYDLVSGSSSDLCLLTSELCPKITDFGLAQPVEGGQTLTHSGFLVGTPGYMAPEQAGGKRALVGPSTDIYALGVVLYQLLTGELPFPGDSTLEVLRAVTNDEPVRPRRLQPQLPRDLEAITLHCLEKEPARRYSSALALAEDLQRFGEGRQVEVRPVGPVVRLARACRRRPLVALLLALLAASLFGGLAGVSRNWLEANWQRDRADAQARQAEDEKREATYQAYRARIAAAVAALQNHDVADAARQLDAAPKDLRGWEWRHLSSRLDDSTAMAQLRAGEPAFLLSDPGGLRVGTFTDTGFRFRDENGREFPERPFWYNANQGFALAGPATEWLLAATVNDGRQVWLRDHTGRVVCKIEPRQGGAAKLALNPARTQVAVGLNIVDGPYRIGIYDTSSGQERAAWSSEEVSQIHALAFSPDGRWLAAGGDDRVIRIWDAATGKPLTQCRGHTSKVMFIGFRQDGARLVTAGHDSTVRQWDVQTGREVEPPYDRHTAEVFAAVYSPDGQRIASAGADRTVRIWRASGRQDQAVLSGHTGAVAALAFSRDEQRLSSASYNPPNNQGDGTVRFWDSAPEASLPVLVGHTSYVYPVAFSADGRWIASGAWDGTVRLWDAATGEWCATLPHRNIVRTLAFTPDSARLVSGGDFDEGLFIWDLATGRVEGRVPAGKSVWSVAVSPDGARIVAGPLSGQPGPTMSVSDIATHRQIGTVAGTPFAFSPDGKWLAGKDAGGETVVVWDAHTFRPVALGRGHTGAINAVAFDHDGRRLVSASSDLTVRLWDAATGECLRVFEGHTDVVYAAVFHPDGTRIASAGRDRVVWLWDTGSGQEVGHLPGHTSYIWSLAFSPDGKTLVSSSGDSTVRLWDTEPLRVRYQARRETAALRPEAERLVELLWKQKNDAAAVVDALRADPALSEPLRQAALRAVLRRVQPAEAAPANPP
jgi:WD40 repeat protein/serine/threonine protein kinase